MNTQQSFFKDRIAKVLFITVIAAACIPSWTRLEPPAALFTGVVFAFIFGTVFPAFTKKTQKYLLQGSVVLLGFTMNVVTALQSGKNGMVITIGSVIAVMLLGWICGRLLKMDSKTSYLISAGTAICGGSAIAAVGPLVDAEDRQMSVSLGTIFILNAVALFIFPPIGHWLGMDQAHFGEWAAIAIHDTSSVVGAGSAYDSIYFNGTSNIACETAALVKCTRALWILPLSFATMLLFSRKGKKFTIPWFIFFFAAAMLVNTYLFPLIGVAPAVSTMLGKLAKIGIAVTLFLIGTSLTPKTLKSCGVKPFIQGFTLWIAIALLSLFVVGR